MGGGGDTISDHLWYSRRHLDGRYGTDVIFHRTLHRTIATGSRASRRGQRADTATVSSCIYNEANLGVTLGSGSGAGSGLVSSSGGGACAGASSGAGFEPRGNERLAWIAAPAAAAVLVTETAQFSSGAGVGSMGGVGCGVGCGGSVSTGAGSSPGATASVAPSFAAGSSPGNQRARAGASASGTNSSAPSRQTGV